MPIYRPADDDSPLVHDRQAVRVGKRELVIGEFLQYPGGFAEFSGVERLDGQIGQGIYKDEEL
jgi:hypothetical protein